MLYPPGKIVPNSIIAVTGTNGKTTTTRLLAHIVKQWLQSRFHYFWWIIFKITWWKRRYLKVQYVLRDPTVEFAVLETARGILRWTWFQYLWYRYNNNIQEDHLGISDIHSGRFSKSKSNCCKTIKRWLNLEWRWCPLYQVRCWVKLQCAYFSLDEESPFIKKLSWRKIVAVYENGFITIKKENGRSG
jgi:cyanophycin synthetase